MALDSSATFRERCIDRGLAVHLPKFESLGWRCLSDLVYATNYSPQATNDATNEQMFLDDIIIKSLGTADHQDKPRLRRLFFEAFALTAADLRRQVEQNPDNPCRVITTAELEEKRRRVERRLTNLVEPDGHFEDNLDVSDRLLQRCIHMYESNRLVYIGFELCTKRDMDLIGVNKDTKWTQTPDGSGFIRMKPAEDEVLCRLSSQFELLHAIMRRGLALEMADALSFDLHEVLRRRLIAAITQVPSEGFLPVGLNQMLDADQVIWQQLYKATREGIKRRSSATRPLDDCMMKVLDSLKTQMALMPRQGSVSAAASSSNQPDQSRLVSSLQKQVEALQKQNKEQKRAKAIADVFAKPPPAIMDKPRPSQEPKDSKAKKAKATGKGSARDPKCPANLPNCCTRSSPSTNLQKMCFAYNTGDCNAAGDGGQCPKGAHLCMRSVNGVACSQAHPQTRHGR